MCSTFVHNCPKLEGTKMAFSNERINELAGEPVTAVGSLLAGWEEPSADVVLHGLHWAVLVPSGDFQEVALLSS